MARITNNKIKILKNSSKIEKSFHQSIAPVIALAQFFGIFPVVSIFNSDVAKIKFKILSVRTVVSILWIGSAITFLSLELLRKIDEGGLNPKSVSGLFFFAVGTTTGILYFRLAFKWNELLRVFKNTEDTLQQSYSLQGWSLDKRIKITSTLLLAAAGFEHLLALSSFIYDRVIQAKVCNWEIYSWIYYFTSRHQSHVFRKFPVNWYTSLWAEYMSVSLTFNWSFIDLTIILFSIGISTKFKMINERLMFFKSKVATDRFWDEIRCHYNKVVELVEYVDEILGNLICLACLCDLYYVCLQLLNVATKLPFLVNAIYFWYSLFFVIGRTFAMFLFASKVNEESLKPLSIFRSIPSDGFFPETQRFCNQIQRSTVALSGKKFFMMQRAIIITIAGTIITYELVLLQFDGDKIVSDMFDPCQNMHDNIVKNKTT